MQTGWGRGVAILNRVTWQDLWNKVTLSEGASGWFLRGREFGQRKGGRESQGARAGVLRRSEEQPGSQCVATAYRGGPYPTLTALMGLLPC